MLAVDRKDYCHTREAYKDNPQPIGSNVTISAPHMHAHALETLAAHLQPGSRALDVGSGSGYLTTCMAIMVCHVLFAFVANEWEFLVANLHAFILICIIILYALGR